MLTEKEIAEKYCDINFRGAFTGARTFQMFLKTDLDEDIGLKQIYNILQAQPFYVMKPYCSTAVVG